MTEESKRLMGIKNETFADRIMASVERYYTRVELQKALRRKIYGDQNSLSLLASIHADRTIQGPGQYSRTDIPRSKGIQQPPSPGNYLIGQRSRCLGLIGVCL